jgi:site-specific DNA-methyltransferase (adenine-specific)|tara:strand:- start:44 stop:658 length:615 start_codon:yes stop_codon:yes gene_type:complete
MIDLKNIDCLEAMKQMDDNQFDLAIVDPPYGINITNSGWVKTNKNLKTKNHWDNETPNKNYFDELKRVSKNQIIWGGNYFLDNLTNTRCFLIWDKQIGECTSFASSELAWTSFDKSTKTFYEHPAKYGKEKIHPTQKPVKLYEWLLDNYANEGDKILDTHLGSGSISLACHNRGFDLTGFEIDSEYYNNAVERLRVHQSQLTMF